MQLSDLLDRLFIKQVTGDPNKDISNIEIDSRRIKPNGLFICLVGSQTDGHCYIGQAISNGAVAIVAERQVQAPADVTVVQVPDTRRAMAILADAFYRRRSGEMKLIGVTGTNGKTTTTHLIEAILSDCGIKTGLIGTLYMKVGEYTEPTANTTPESLELQRLLHSMSELGASYAVLEVSSHALDMGRVRGCRFRTVVFLNLTHDHLDYHQSMDSYLDAKSLLFSQLGNTYAGEPKFAVLNADDPASRVMANRTAAQVITFGIDNKADVWAKRIEIHPTGTLVTVETFMGTVDLRLQLLGKFNVYNVLAALSAGLAERIPLERMTRSLESFRGVKGRFEPVYAGQRFSLIVDYAHNPDGLEKALKTARELTKGKLICVVGCEGDRDKLKRPVMASIAAAYSDKAIFTSDNPRSEQPESILDDMLAGVKDHALPADRYMAVADRRSAIRKAIELVADSGDCVIIAGKGHESHQIVRKQRIPFNDVEVAEELVKQLSEV